jgi:hypothetical protein
MPKNVEVLLYDNKIVCYRQSWTSPVDILITVKNCQTGDLKKNILLKNEKIIEINNLDRNNSYCLKIRGKNRFYAEHWIKKELTISPVRKRLRTLIIGSGRCGTTSLALFLNGKLFTNGQKVIARHETLFEEIVDGIIHKNYKKIQMIVNGFWHHIESAPHMTMLTDYVDVDNTIHIIRDGRRVVQSGLNRGWYQDDTIWNRMKPNFDGTVFKKCCKFWVFMNEKAQKVACHSFRLEDLSVSTETINSLLKKINVQSVQSKLPVANVGSKPSTIMKWSGQQKEVFEKICGPLMDHYYPDWRSDY